MFTRSAIVARNFGTAARKLFVGGNWKCNGSIAKVQEIVYLDSRALRQLLAYVSRTARSVQVTVSDDEQLERIFPQAIPHREDHLMARLNSPALFNKLYNTKAHHAKDAFDLLKKPMWNHSR